MDTKHTPGPWGKTDHVDGQHLYVPHADITTPGGFHIATVRLSNHTYGGTPAEAAEKSANAALIAAAPELLEAARYALDCATHKRDGRTLEEMAQRVRELLTSAIAKAEGRS